MKTRLSDLVYDLITRENIDHALVLVQAAKNGKITTRDVNGKVIGEIAF